MKKNSKEVWKLIGICSLPVSNFALIYAVATHPTTTTNPVIVGGFAFVLVAEVVILLVIGRKD